MPDLTDEQLQVAIDFQQRKHQEIMAAVSLLMAEAEHVRLSLAGLLLLSQGRTAAKRTAEAN